jgi:wyosine [tRNA(Phe)-imidazoG37] synthetase (radical SAM superfamily)
MLVAGLNDRQELIEAVADFVARLRPDIAYLAVPTRPPAEAWVQPPAAESINRAYQIFSDRVRHVEYLIGYEGNAFTCTGNVEQDLLSITAVHPMREEAVGALLAQAGADWSIVHRLVAQDQLVEVAYAGQRFFVRRLREPKVSQAES